MLRTLALFLVVGWSTTGAAAVAEDTVLLLVRHAEKEDGGANPDLSPRGQRRAAALAAIAETWRVNAVVSSDFCRTAQTAAAVAGSRRMPIVVQPISGGRGGIETCDPPIELPVLFLADELASTDAFKEWLLEDQAGRVVLLVGHSNTVPELIAAFGGEAVPRIAIDESEYSRLFVLTLPADGGDAQLVEERFDED